MGNYLFSPEVLREALIEDSIREDSNHDFGRDLIPALINRVPVYAYNFMTNRIRGDSEVNLSYWRDVGTLDAYYEANMDLRDARPQLNLYNAYWPLRTAYYDQPPAKFVFDENGRRGLALHSVIGEGCIVSGGAVRNSVLGRSVFVHSYSLVEDSVIMDYATIGRHAKVRRAIVDKNVYHSRGRGDRLRSRARPAAIFRHRFGPRRDSQGPQARTVGTVECRRHLRQQITSSIRSESAKADLNGDMLRRGVAPAGSTDWRAGEVGFPALARSPEEHAPETRSSRIG